jgi:hypothetical protein
MGSNNSELTFECLSGVITDSSSPYTTRDNCARDPGTPAFRCGKISDGMQ